jgi:hypothetical protein
VREEKREKEENSSNLEREKDKGNEIFSTKNI